MRQGWEVAEAQDTGRKLTQPLGGAVSILGGFIATLFVLFLVLLAVDSHFTFYGFGYGPACAHVPSNGLTQGGGGGNVLAHMRPGASSGASTSSLLSVCANQPTAGQRVLATLTQAPSAVLYVTILLLLALLLRAVRRGGPFAVLIARRLRFLAWFILAGSLVVVIGESVAGSIFASTVVTDTVPVLGNAINATINGFFPPLLIVCGLLTLARVIRVGARMNDDLAGTV